jgi:hypothetical protein
VLHQGGRVGPVPDHIGPLIGSRPQHVPDLEEVVTQVHIMLGHQGVLHMWNMKQGLGTCRQGQAWL